MQLSSEEKRVLTLLDDAKAQGFAQWCKQFVDISVENIEQAVKRMLSLGLIETRSLGDEDDLWYFHTKKVTPAMIDEELKYRHEHGDLPLQSAPQSSLDELMRSNKKK